MPKFEEKTSTIGPLNIAYRQMGSGRPMILLHGGWATGKLNWSDHYQWLSENYQVFSPDHRGHGATNNPPPGFVSYSNLAWEIISFIESLKLDQKPIIMGHSSGGLISLHMSIFQPDLIAAQILIGVHRNIGISPHFKKGMEAFFHTRDFRNQPSKTIYMLHHPINSLALWQAHGGKWFDLLGQAWPMWVKPLELEAQDFSKINVPTLLVHPQQDEFGSLTDARDLANVIPKAQLEIAQEANHLFVISKPSQLRQIILPFLEKLS